MSNVVSHAQLAVIRSAIANVASMIVHQTGCNGHEDPREACECDALVFTQGVGAVIRPRGMSGLDLYEVALDIAVAHARSDSGGAV